MDTPGDRRNVREVKIFVSSPGDVMAERQRLERVTERLNTRLGGAVHLRCVRWEEKFYKAHDTFQAQIESAATCDIVVSIFWTRLGTELPPEFGEHLPDGRPYPSGTAYEVLTALEAAREKPMPDVYVFRKTQRPLYPDPDDETETQLFETQLKALRGFWEEWFRNRAGQFHAAFNSFATTDEFETQAEKLLYEWLAAKGLLEHEVRWRIAEQGSPFRGLLPFEASHADVFFGRTAEIERGRERLIDAAAGKAPFLLVLGASGSGKSSLARAGLIPRLIAPGAVTGVDVWRVARHAPGLGDPDPLRSLAAALLDAEALPELAGTPKARRTASPSSWPVAAKRRSDWCAGRSIAWPRRCASGRLYASRRGAPGAAGRPVRGPVRRQGERRTARGVCRDARRAGPFRAGLDDRHDALDRLCAAAGRCQAC